MKRAIATLILMSSLTAMGMTEMTIPLGVAYDPGIRVAGVAIRTMAGDIYSAARPQREADGTWSWVLDPMSTSLTGIGLDGLPLHTVNILGDGKVTSGELTAAGAAIGVDWATATGDAQAAVVIRAFVQKLADNVGQDAAWVAAVYAQLMGM